MPISASITVPYTELSMPDSLREEADRDSVSAIKKYKMAWQDRWTFARQIAGIVDEGGLVLTQTLPYQYPDNQDLFASSISLAPCGRPGQGDNQVKWTYAIATVTFTSPPVYRTIELNFASEVLSLPSKAFKFLSDNAPCETSVPVQMPTIEITITHNRVPLLNVLGILSQVGTLNNAIFEGCAIGTLLFVGAQSKQGQSILGTQQHDLTYKFVYRRVPWLKQFRPDGNDFDIPVARISGNPIYALTDFTKLFNSTWVEDVT